MTDQNDQQNPPPSASPAQVAAPTPTAAQTVATTVETKVEETFSSMIKDLWSRYGILFFLVGIGLIALKYSSVAMEILGWSSKKDLQSAQKTDAQLKAQEEATNKEADALVKEATDLPKTEGQVDDDWDKK